MIVKALVTKSPPVSASPMDCSRPELLSPWNSPRKRILWRGWLTIPFSGDLPGPEIEHVSPEMQADSLPSELPSDR